MLDVGRVVKPHGLKGEVVVELFTNRTERVDAGTVLASERGPLKILWSSPFQGRWIVAFDGVTTREAADQLRGTVLQAPPIEDPDALWVHDLIGSEVLDTAGTTLGKVDAVQANPASDLLVLEDGGLIPLTFLVSHEPGRVVVDPPAGLLD
jgi:16S rRNA processing protein RimM